MHWKTASAAALLLTGVAASDSWVVYEFPDGRSVAPVESTPAAMVAESVLIEPLNGDTASFPPRMRVDCVFYIMNPTDSLLDLAAGFPLESHFGSTYHAMADSAYYAAYSWSGFDTDTLSPTDFVPPELDFQVSVDGRALPVRFRFQRQEASQGLLWRPLNAVWDLTLQPGRTVRMNVAYTTAWNYHSSDPEGVYRLRYLLRSGAPWAGAIDSALVRLRVPDAIPAPSLEPSCVSAWSPQPPPRAQSERTLTWSFQNLEPDRDVVMEVLCADPEDALSWHSFESFAGEIAWTRDSLVPTAINRSWELTWTAIPTPMLLQWLRRGASEEPQVLEELGVSPTRALAMLDHHLENMSDFRQVVREAGLDSLLPLFVLKRRWTGEDLTRLRRRPELRRGYLNLLTAMEPCLGGEVPNSAEISSFFSLVGWYWPGWQLEPAAFYRPLPADQVAAFLRGNRRLD